MSENSSAGQKHPYHLVDPSPLPFLSSVAGLAMAAGLVFYMHYDAKWLLILGTIGLLTVMFLWWRCYPKSRLSTSSYTWLNLVYVTEWPIYCIRSYVLCAFFWAFDASLTPNSIEEFAETLIKWSC